MSCVFCNIIKGNIPSQKVYEDEDVLAFKDINPAAPVHIIIIPKKHIESVMDLNESNIGIVEKIFAAAKKIAVSESLGDKGFRIVTNCGESAGQSVKHLHFHLLGGRDMQWPPG